MGQLKRKNYWLDETTIKKAQKLFGTKSETEAIQKALEMAVFQEEAAKAWKENAGYGGLVDLNGR
ncbi:MAG TPA: hypothetical protein VLY20_12080 [Nitrospiria bacterium]|nr:hypothetical protein [Nitrospiria bacterium]